MSSLLDLSMVTQVLLNVLSVVVTPATGDQVMKLIVPMIALIIVAIVLVVVVVYMANKEKKKKNKPDFKDSDF